MLVEGATRDSSVRADGQDLNLGPSGYEPDSWGAMIQEFQGLQQVAHAASGQERTRKDTNGQNQFLIRPS